MSTTIIATILFILASFATADYFIFPTDSSDPTNDDASQNPVFVAGDKQTFTWVADAPAVNLSLFQYGEDSYVICTNCEGGSFTWNGHVPQDLSYGRVFYLEILADDASRGADSRYFNISDPGAGGAMGRPSSIIVTPSLPPAASLPPSAHPSAAPQPPSSPDTQSSASPPRAASSPGTALGTKIAPSVPASSAALPPPPAATPATSLLSDPSPSPTTTRYPATDSTSTPTPLRPTQASKASPSPLKLGLSLGAGLLSAGVLLTGAFICVHRRKRRAPVSAQSPPPWSASLAPISVVPEAKGMYERVEMDVPGSALGGGGPCGKGEREMMGHGFEKAGLPYEGGGCDKGGVEGPMQVELP